MDYIFKKNVRNNDYTRSYVSYSHCLLLSFILLHIMLFYCKSSRNIVTFINRNDTTRNV